MKMTMIEEWSDLKHAWNNAFLAACGIAQRVSSEIKEGCGQCVLPGDLLRKLVEKSEFIPAMVYYKAKPVSEHWDGSLAAWKSSLEKLQAATPERLHACAAELLG